MTMKNQTICGDGQMLVAYLYDECDANERVRMERHLEGCDACVSELAELGSARQHLSMWAPPAADLGFRIVSDRPAAVAPAAVAWWRQPLPAWGQAVAATVLFGLGMAAGSRPTIGGGAVGAGRRAGRRRRPAVGQCLSSAFGRPSRSGPWGCCSCATSRPPSS